MEREPPFTSMMGDSTYPKDPSELVEQGWKDVTNPRDKSGNRTYENPKTGKKVRYDETGDGERTLS